MTIASSRSGGEVETSTNPPLETQGTDAGKLIAGGCVAYRSGDGAAACS
jgi:hypothetical protein